MKYAGFWRRFAAIFIDGLVMGVTVQIINTLLGVISVPVTANITLGLELIVVIGYAVVYQSNIGQTLGKKVLGIKIVDASGKTPNMTTFFLREIIGKLVDGFTFGIGYLWMLWDGKSQCLHDKIASTFVVKV